MIRSLHILDHSIPLHSGYTFRTAALLREQRALGWETFHLTSPKQGASSGPIEEVDGLRFYRTRSRSSTLSRLPLAQAVALMQRLETRIEEVANDIRPDIIHAHSPVLNAIPAIRVARRRGIPIVYEIRAFWEDAAVDHGTTRAGSLRYRASRWLESRAMRKVDHVFTICEGLRADILARGIADSKVSVIPNAVDVEAFRPARPPERQLLRKYGLEGNTVIGFVGSFYAYEGLDLLLDAFPTILRQEPATRLLLVGGGPQEENLRQRATALGLDDKVVFAGRVAHSEVSRYYDLVDILAYPRHSIRLTELVTPLKPLEAMAQGQVFVASDVGGHRELIEHGKTGMLFRAGDAGSLAAAILDLVRQRERWPELKTNGRRFVEEVRNWRNSVANYRAPYLKLIGKQDTGD